MSRDSELESRVAAVGGAMNPFGRFRASNSHMTEAVPGTGDPLLALARTGDHASFEALIGPLVGIGYRLACTMLSDPEEAEDAVQEATFRAWTRFRQFRHDQSRLRAWYLSIVANECRSIRRRRWSFARRL